MFVTSNEMTFGNTNTQWFGTFEDIDDYELDSYTIKQSDVK